MYSMCAERIEAESGTTLLWHALDRNGDALCARMAGGTAGGTAGWQPTTADDRDEYCGDCMNAVASAFRHGPDGAGGPVGARAGLGAGPGAGLGAPLGAGGGAGATEGQSDPAPPNPERRTRGR
ncbi:hypothetical protein SSP531S_42750 [Streptomyces spongiicola]|uniref:Uncharacterized protein n=2 Tax=Streptomyces spongiicola TaxID=1690221 RepID=A0A388T3S5_9ACTN|nr:hypothetical protein SSP531S_42750 [Streptomyces spongiicola]